MKIQPKITLVMPSFNQAAFLEEAICSVLAQKYPRLEFILLDGGSSDGSVGIIQQYANHLHYWHSRPDAGQADALQQGFAMGSGELMGWLNSDDVLLPGAIERIVQAYHANPNGGLFAGNLVWIDQQGKIVRCKRHPSQAPFFIRHGVFAVAQPGSFFTPQDYAPVGGLNASLRYVMDADLYIRMLAQGTRYIHVDAWLSGFRLQHASKTVSESALFLQEYERVRLSSWHSMKPSRIWKILYKAWQVVNGNYPRMTVETLLAHGQHWQSWAKLPTSTR